MLYSVTIGFLSAAAVVAGQQYTEFRPLGYNDLEPLDVGRGPDPLDFTLHLSQVGVQSPVCLGVHDVLTVTHPTPIVGNISQEAFTVMVCPIEYQADDNYTQGTTNYDLCETVTPVCAGLQLDGATHERRTVSLHGQFAEFQSQNATLAPHNIAIPQITFLVDGNQSFAYGTGERKFNSGQGLRLTFGFNPMTPVLGYGEGPFLVDATLQNLSAPLNTAATDPNGCAALHPSATYAVRLLFASSVHQSSPDNATDGFPVFAPDSAAAAALFSVRVGAGGDSASQDRVVGTAGASRTRPGSVVDVCVEAAAGEPRVDAVVINCTADAPLSPAGFPCSTPIKAFLRTTADETAGRDPATFAAGRTIEFCLGAPQNCPGGAPAPAPRDPDVGDDDDFVGDEDDGPASGAGSARRGVLATAAVALAAAAAAGGLGL